MRICKISTEDAQWIIDRLPEEPLFSPVELAEAINVAVEVQDSIAPETDERLTAEEMREKCLSIYSK